MGMDTPTITMGRPKGKPFPHVRSLRFTPRDGERLRLLAEIMETTEAQVIRVAIRELARREGVE